ncbi:MAG: TVP38/TMEM64 family protein [Bacteroidales bacterium]|nr:TVP38/TMEM64 family protein [Bacteroidales bacterium]MBN2758492.1 TVP38/TMEM64 family protein [Bacteroidales bacterium]
MKFYLQILYLLTISLLIFLFFYFKVNQLLTIENINNLRNYFLSLGNIAAIYMIILYILFNIAAIPRVFFTIFSGYVFGIFYGFIFAWIATMAGLTVTFISVRYLFRDKFNKKFGNKKLIEKLNNQIDKKGLLLIIILRAIYIVPSSILNYSFGFTKIKTSKYILGSAIGFLPVVFINVYSGYLINKSISQPINFNILVPFIFLLLVLLFSLNKRLNRFLA